MFKQSGTIYLKISALFFMLNDFVPDCARSPKDKRSREIEHRNDEKGILHPMKSSQLSSRDRKPMHNNCVDKVNSNVYSDLTNL